MILAVDWLDATAPGTVRIRLAAENGSEIILVLRQIYEIRKEARYLRALRKNGKSIPMRQTINHLAREWLPDLPAPPHSESAAAAELEMAIESLAGLLTLPLNWLVEVELAERHPELRYPRLLALSAGADAYFELLRNRPFVEILPSELHGTLEALMLAELCFVSDHSRGVIDQISAVSHLPAWPRALQIRDHFRNFIRRPSRPGGEFQLIIDTAAIAGLMPPSRPIQTQGSLW